MGIFQIWSPDPLYYYIIKGKEVVIMSTTKELQQNDLRSILGGGNATDCAAGIGASAAAIGLATTGPVGWALLGLGVAAGTAGFATGWSCTKLVKNGD